MSETNPPLNPSGTLAGEEPRARSAQVEYVVSQVLRYGVLLSFLIILLGSVMLFVEGGRDVAVRLTGPPHPHNPAEVINGVLHLQPKAIIDLGLMLLIATPVIRVAVSVLAFLAEEDYVYTLITLFVLAVLLASFFLGAAGG